MNIGIIGLGLIGGSLGRAIIKKTEHTVLGYDISDDTLIKAQMMPCIHSILTDEDYKKLDMLIYAINPRAFISILDKALPKLSDGCIIMDIGGNKKAAVKAMKNAAKGYPNLSFAATHPMAGREFYGINHSISTLFEKASLILIPAAIDIKPLTLVKNFLLELGFSSIVLSDEITHDKIIAYTSQLAHILSSAYVQSETAPLHDGFSAGSFRDLTRVAKMNASMWTELITDNSENVLNELETLINKLNEYKNAIITRNETELYNLFENGNRLKEVIEKASREWKKSSND